MILNSDKKFRVKKRFILGALGLALALAAGYLALNWGKETTDDAQVDGHIYTVTPRVTGYVLEVLVRDNQVVEAGQPLLRLDPVEYEVALAEARSALASLELGAPLQLAQTGFSVSGTTASRDSRAKALEQAAMQERAAKAAADQAGLDLARAADLVRTKSLAQAELDRALTAKHTADANLEAARRARQVVERDLGRAESDIGLAATGKDAAEIKARQAEAQRAVVRQAELDLSHATVLAPVRGLVTHKAVEAGQMVSKGQTLMAVVPLDPDQVWITANFKESQLGRMRPGQKAEISIDAYPGQTFSGTVESIMAGTGAAFSLFPPENAAGNYVKVVQRVPVKIALDPGQPGLQGPDAPVLRIGLSAVPVVRVR